MMTRTRNKRHVDTLATDILGGDGEEIFFCWPMGSLCWVFGAGD